MDDANRPPSLPRVRVCVCVRVCECVGVYLRGKSTILSSFSLVSFVYENLLRWMMRTSGRDQRSSFFVASWCFLHTGQYLKQTHVMVPSDPLLITWVCRCVLPWILLLQRLHGGEQLDTLLQRHRHLLLRNLHAGVFHVLLQDGNRKWERR